MGQRITDVFTDDPRDKKAETKETPEGDFIRRTYMIRQKHIDLIDRQAYWERREKQQVLDEILEAYYKDKKIKPYPGQ